MFESLNIPCVWQFIANLVFISTAVYGGIIKLVYRPKAYSGDFSRMFPAWRYVTFLYVMQVFQVPYLLNIGSGDALFYANSFELLFFPLITSAICLCYFFPRELNSRRLLMILSIPGIVVFMLLFVDMLGVGSIGRYMDILKISVSIIGVGYIFVTVLMWLKIGRTIKIVNLSEYSNTDDFPVRFASNIRWLPLVVCLFVSVCYIVNDPWVKLIFDVVFTVVGAIFLIITLNPWLKQPFTDAEQDIIQESNNSNFRMSKIKFQVLSVKLTELFEEESLYSDPHITVDVLLHKLGTNRNYLSEVIVRSGYKSFYDMINYHRVKCAIKYIQESPDDKMYEIAERCGFSSQAAMNKAFRQQGKGAPTSYR